MPHSLHSDSPPAQLDDEMVDAPSQNLEGQPGIESSGEEGTASDVNGQINEGGSRLEDIFDDEESDEEFSSSVPQVKAEEESQERVRVPPSAKHSDPEVMKAFYQRLFPFRYLFQWLNHSASPTTDFAHREFAFTLQNDAYLRYQSFPTADLLRKQCISLNPSRFEIGPVYSTNPRDRKTLRKSTAFRPIAKELVFDIDMTDYDEIRTCCTGANICGKCWTFITMAIKVVDVALKDDFGFRHVLWVYSGRRGAHAWVCDRRAREMDDQKRRAIAGYLELLRGGDKSGKRVNVKRPLHPHLDRSLRILKERFHSDVLATQDPWSSSDKSDHLLRLLPDKALNESLRKKWDSAPGRSSVSKWSDIDSLAKTGASDNPQIGKLLLEAKQDIVLEYTYPRLDAEVSKKLNHLLKSPFCVHPGTGRVCVPIDARKAEDFDPLEVPTVAKLLAEIDTWDRDHAVDVPAEEGGEEKEVKKVADWEKTSLKPYVDFFKGFVSTLLKDEKGGKRGREEAPESMEF